MTQEVVQEKTEEVICDLLNRQEFVDKLIDITERLAKNKRSACYAVNGSWGAGKSFVLDMFLEQLVLIQQEGNIGDKYLIFPYNCWEYDYYEEPIIAIVASMLDEIDKDVNLLSEDKRDRIKGFLKAVGSGLLLTFNSAIKEKTGVDVQKIHEVIQSGNANTAEAVEQNHEYDPYFAFKNVLNRFRETIKSLSKDQTIIFVVDELDRCLPGYMIKVLERLHHIFYEIPNVQVVLSMDKEQISHTVRSIYGENTDVNKYLAKFINFEVDLPIGNLTDEYEKQHAYYLGKFEKQCSESYEEDVNEFYKNILKGIDMRGRIEIINKCNLLHDMILGEEKRDHAFMCVEMFLAVLKYWEATIPDRESHISIHVLFNTKRIVSVSTGLDYISQKYLENQEYNNYLSYDEHGRSYVRRDNIWGVVLATYRRIIGYKYEWFSVDDYVKLGLRKYSEDFWNLLQIIN